MASKFELVDGIINQINSKEQKKPKEEYKYNKIVVVKNQPLSKQETLLLKTELIKVWEFEYLTDYVFRKDSIREKMENIYKTNILPRLEKAKNKNGNYAKSVSSFWIEKLPNEKEFDMKLIVGKTGFGVATGVDISKGQLIMPYIGEVLFEDDCDEDYEYIMRTTEHGFFIDSKRVGTICRYVNHSCQPSCVMTERWCNGKLYVLLKAKKDIPKGTELTYDYHFQVNRSDKFQKCLCGSEKCRGQWTTLLPPDPDALSVCNFPIGKDEEGNDIFCSEEFESIKDRSYHKFLVHKHKKELICPRCDRKYKSLGSYCNHARSDHGIGKGGQASLQKKCLKCKEPFTGTTAEFVAHEENCNDTVIKWIFKDGALIQLT